MTDQLSQAEPDGSEGECFRVEEIMKTIRRSTRCALSEWKRPAGCVMVIAILLSMSSCTTIQTGSVSVDGANQALPDQGRWYLVSENPPTYFPVGVPEEAETDFWHGEWVNAGENDARWFIPKMGVNGRTEAKLRDEALLMMTSAKKLGISLNEAASLGPDGLISLVTLASDGMKRANKKANSGKSSRFGNIGGFGGGVCPSSICPSGNMSCHSR